MAAIEEKSQDHVQVVIRIRPPLPRELSNSLGVPFKKVVKACQKQVTISESINLLDLNANNKNAYTFDRVYDEDSTQKEVYDTTARKVVSSCLEGYNATIFAYGQTGTGKTYTMDGGGSAFEDRGIIPRAIEQIFSHIRATVSPQKRFLVRASYLQIYNDIISDLLMPERTNLNIREESSKDNTSKKTVFVEGLSECVVKSPQEIYQLMKTGANARATGQTMLNELSSRSHAILILIVEQSETTFLDEKQREISPEEFHEFLCSEKFKKNKYDPESFVRQNFKVGKLNLVDLAGSERVRASRACGQQLEETKKINQSLSALGNVISALTNVKGRTHIPYRNSKLTRILQDSLGGNCKTTMMATISPAKDAISETLSTIKFANRAKNIRNHAFVNEDLDKNSLLRRYEKELKRLRAELEKRKQNVVDQRKLLELEEQKRQAEEDKMAAVQALEKRSREFMREKLAKKKLEEKIASLSDKVLAGSDVQKTPQFQNALLQQRNRIRAEYTNKLTELEKERNALEEKKSQVDRYKQLLLKQRDIMVAMTKRLNERDDQISRLQEEIHSHEANCKILEEKLDNKTASLIHLQRVALEQNQPSLHRENQTTSLQDSNETISLHESGLYEGDMLKRMRIAVQNEIEARLRNEFQQRLNASDVPKRETLATDKAMLLEKRVQVLTEKYKRFREDMFTRIQRKDVEIAKLRTAKAEQMPLSVRTNKRFIDSTAGLKDGSNVKDSVLFMKTLVDNIIASKKENQETKQLNHVDSQVQELSILVDNTLNLLE